MYEVLDKGVCRLENSTGKVLKTTVNVSRLKTFTPNPMNTEQVGTYFFNTRINNEKCTVFLKGNEEIVTRTSKTENQPKKVRS